jgi:hypothetical protein
MKTKKEILKWWCDRGKIVDTRKDSDWDSFWREIDKKELKTEIRKKGDDCVIEINKKGWKYGVSILFIDNEAVKIAF